MPYPWQQGDELLAADLNAAIANAGAATQISAAITAWLLALPIAPGAAGTWWNNNGVPTYVQD
jgi:hypothetical protein